MTAAETDDDGPVTPADIAEAKARWARSGVRPSLTNIFARPVLGNGLRGDALLPEFDGSRSRPPARDHAEQLKAVRYAMLVAAEMAHVHGTDPQPILDALAELARDPEKLDGVLKSADLAWVAYRGPRGGIGAQNDQTGRIIYGMRAKQALAYQERRGRRQASADRARHLARTIREKGGGASAEHFEELATHLPALHINELRQTRRALGATFQSRRKRDGMLQALLEHAQAKVEGREPPKRAGGKQWWETGDSLAAKVRQFGGIDPDSAALKAHYSGVKEAMEYGIPLGIFRKGGQGLDSLASELASAGHLIVPEGEDASATLLDQLAKGVKLHYANADEEYRKAQETYYREREEAEQYASESEIAEVVRGGEEDGRREAQEELLGEGGGSLPEGEAEGVDTSFPFGSQAEEPAPATPAESASGAEFPDLSGSAGRALDRLPPSVGRYVGQFADPDRPLGERLNALADLDTYALDPIVTAGLSQQAGLKTMNNELIRHLASAYSRWESGPQTSPRFREMMAVAADDAERKLGEAVPALRKLADEGVEVQDYSGRPADLRAAADLYDHYGHAAVGEFRRAVGLTPTASQPQEESPHATETGQQQGRDLAEHQDRGGGGEEPEAGGGNRVERGGQGEGRGEEEVAPKPAANTERAARRLVKDITGPQIVTQQRAYHGEVGPNGEVYPGGAFIATTDLPKREKDKLKRSAGRGVEVESGRREVPKPGQMSIYDKLKPGWYFNPRTGDFARDARPWQQLTPEERAGYEELLDKYKSGERWVPVNARPDLASLDDVARLYVGGEPVPGAVLDRLPAEWRDRLKKYQSGEHAPKSPAPAGESPSAPTATPEGETVPATTKQPKKPPKTSTGDPARHAADLSRAVQAAVASVGKARQGQAGEYDAAGLKALYDAAAKQPKPALVQTVLAVTGKAGDPQMARYYGKMSAPKLAAALFDHTIGRVEARQRANM